LKIILINELNNFAITKAPTVAFTGRNVHGGCFRIRNAEASRSITLHLNHYNLGTSSAQEHWFVTFLLSTLCCGYNY
jgi:hypothetical protein